MLSSSELIKHIISFLPNKEKHNFALCNNYYYAIVNPIIIYSYNEYIKNNDGNTKNELFMCTMSTMCTMCRKWSVKNCTNEMLEDIIKKNINIYSLEFNYAFNESIAKLKVCGLINSIIELDNGRVLLGETKGLIEVYEPKN